MAKVQIRSEVIRMRVTPDEKRRIERKAAYKQMTVSAYLRSVALPPTGLPNVRRWLDKMLRDD